MRLSRYNQIKAMAVRRAKNAPPSVPQGYGYGAWHQALVDIDAAIMGTENEKKWLAMEATIGRKTKGAGTTMTFKVIDMLEGDLDGSHIATLPTQEEWMGIIKQALTLVKVPAADSVEVERAAADLMQERKDRDLAAANARIQELEAANAKLMSQGGQAPERPQ